jgi:hypothetical protein
LCCKHKGKYGQITEINGHREWDGFEANLQKKQLKQSAAEQAGGQGKSVVVLRVGSWDHHGRQAGLGGCETFSSMKMNIQESQKYQVLL